MRLPRERFDYSPIVDREPVKLPDGARVAAWTIVNVEEWNIEAPMPRTVLTTPAGVSDLLRLRFAHAHHHQRFV
jgi:allantoinase